MPRLVVLSGAGMSAESGIPTFRGADGLWNGYRIEQVACPAAWQANPQLVLDFYNQRRQTAATASPNAGHRILAELEQHLEVVIITQNVDNLHERAGSNHVVHLHGLLTQSRSTVDPNLVYDIAGDQLNIGDLCERGSQLRPHIVWFGEAVPMISIAAELCATADIFVVVGTSLVVYPAAGLIDNVPSTAQKFVIDPTIPLAARLAGFVAVEQNASSGLKFVTEQILSQLR